MSIIIKLHRNNKISHDQNLGIHSALLAHGRTSIKHLKTSYFMVIKFIINLCRLKVLNLRETSSYLANSETKIRFLITKIIRSLAEPNPNFLDIFCDEICCRLDNIDQRLCFLEFS